MSTRTLAHGNEAFASQLPHLAIVTPLSSRTGIGQYGYYVSGAMAYTGRFARITLLTEIAPDVQCFECQPQVKIEQVWHINRLDASRRVLARLRELQPDLVWYNLGVSSFGRSPLANTFGLLGPALSRIAGLPTVVTRHELIEQADLQALRVPGGRLALWAARLIRFLTTQADVVCVTLRQHAEWFSVRGLKTRVAHIPHGVFNAPELLANQPDPELLIFGHLAPFRGLELMLEVFPELRTRHPSLRLTIAGAEHPRFPNYLGHLRRAFGDHQDIRWMGYVPEAQLRNLFSRATVVVLPYTATTGASSVLYRAAGWGRSIVASDLPELRATADEEQLLVEFFPSGDKAGLIAALERLLTDSARRAMQVQHNYHKIVNHLTLSHTCQAYLRTFESVLASYKRNIRILVPSTTWKHLNEP